MNAPMGAARIAALCALVLTGCSPSDGVQSTVPAPQDATAFDLDPIAAAGVDADSYWIACNHDELPPGVSADRQPPTDVDSSSVILFVKGAELVSWAQMPVDSDIRLCPSVLTTRLIGPLSEDIPLTSTHAISDIGEAWYWRVAIPMSELQ